MRKIVDIGILIAVLIGGFFITQNAVTIGDWWHSLQYNPEPSIVKLADDSGMNAKGRQLFYRFSPQVLKENDIVRICGEQKLGCAAGRNIYILKNTDSLSYNRSIVTAAHEMLHVAYSRLDKNEISNVNELIDRQLKLFYDEDVLSQLNGFVNTDDYYNEAHSYIGSQSEKLLSDLETYYKKYFDDRNKTVEAYRLSPEG